MLRKNDQTKSIADLCRSDDPRSNPAEVQQFLLSKKLLENERNKLKEWTELAHFLKNCSWLMMSYKEAKAGFEELGSSPPKGLSKDTNMFEWLDTLNPVNCISLGRIKIDEDFLLFFFSFLSFLFAIPLSFKWHKIGWIPKAFVRSFDLEN